MSKIKILIVEDESLVATSLEYQLDTLGYQVQAIAKSYDEALRECAINEPDLVLMDIKIKGDKDGIDTANRIAELYELPIIFLSDLKDNATMERAIKSPSYSFIEKPVSEFTLKAQVEFAIGKHYTKLPRFEDAEDPLKESLFVKTNSGYIKIQMKDIMWIEADGSYCKVKTQDKEFLLSKSMKEFCEHLNPRVFIRIHKSHTINATIIDEILGSEVSIGGENLRIGNSYIKSFKERLNIV